MSLKSISSLSTNVIMAGVDMFYFAETHTQTTHHNVKVPLVVSVDLTILASVNRNFTIFTSDDAKQVFNTILIQSISQNKISPLSFTK